VTRFVRRMGDEEEPVQEPRTTTHQHGVQKVRHVPVSVKTTHGIEK